MVSVGILVAQRVTIVEGVDIEFVRVDATFL